jgi:iron(III) transport system substrate-binding protein
MKRTLTRRKMLAASGAGVASFVTGGASAAYETTRIDNALIAAARKEGKVTWYTSVELPLAERIAKVFESKYPGVQLRVERSGAERNFQRIGQEYASRIYVCDVVNSSDAAHLILWKRQKLLAPCLPEEVLKNYPPEHRDPDGMYCSWRLTLCPMGYNTRFVRKEDAPRSYADLVSGKWSGKIVKAHPGYSGTIMTATQQLSRDLGWSFFEKLAQQRVMQVQSASDPPRKLAAGERTVMADGTEYVISDLKSRGEPVEPVYAAEGTPPVVGPSAVMAFAPSPNAARLFHAWSMTAEAQQLNVDVGFLRSVHGQIKDRTDRPRLSDIKLLKEDPVAVADQVEDLKKRYLAIFKV